GCGAERRREGREPRQWRFAYRNRGCRAACACFSRLKGCQGGLFAVGGRKVFIASKSANGKIAAPMSKSMTPRRGGRNRTTSAAGAVEITTFPNAIRYLYDRVDFERM